MSIKKILFHKKFIFISFSILTIIFFSGNCYALNLKEVETRASNNNYIIKQYKLLYQSSKNIKESEFKNFLPDVSTNYSYKKLSQQPYQIVNNSKIFMSSTSNFQWNLTVSQPLFSLYLLNKYKYAKYNELFSKAQIGLIKNQIVTNAKIAYLNVLYAQKILKVRQITSKEFSSHLKDAQYFFKNGLIPSVDLLKSEVAYYNSKQELQQAQTNLINAIAQLNQLINEPIEKQHTFTQIKKVMPLKDTLKSLYSDIYQRPDIKALSFAIYKAKSEIGETKSAYYPQIELIGNYSRAGENADIDENRYSNNSMYSLLLIASWNIFNWGKTKNKVQAINLQEKSLQEELNNLKTYAQTQILNAYNQAMVAYNNISVAKTSVAEAIENYKLTNLRYKNQLATSTDILDARTLLTQAEMDYYNSIYGYAKALENLSLSIGKDNAFDYLIRFN